MTPKRKRSAPKKAPRPEVVPAMRACPDCGVSLEAGKGKHNLAWHGCSDGPSTVDLVEADALKQMRLATADASVMELIALLTLLWERKGSSTSQPSDMDDWLQRR